MSTGTTPSLETVAGLYKAAWIQTHQADFALARVREAIARHGFTEDQVREAAGIMSAETTTAIHSPCLTKN